MKNEAAQQLGRLGGQRRSEKKTAAARANAKKTRGKWVTAIRFTSDSMELEHTIVVKGKGPESAIEYHEWCHKKIEKEYPHLSGVEYLESTSQKL